MNKRVDKLNLDRMSDMADIQAKMGLVGKSASRHLETLRAQLFRECQTLFELATKPCSIVFDAFREDSYTDGGKIFVKLHYKNCKKITNINYNWTDWGDTII